MLQNLSSAAVVIGALRVKQTKAMLQYTPVADCKIFSITQTLRERSFFSEPMALVLTKQFHLECIYRAKDPPTNNINGRLRANT